MTGPISSTDDRARRWLALAGGILATLALVVGVVQLWPDGGDGADDDVSIVDVLTSTTDGAAPTVPGAPTGPSTRPDDDDGPSRTRNLFHDAGAAASAIAEIAAAAGDPQQVIEIAVYDTYAFLAYRDPAQPGNIDRRIWRNGDVEDPSPNPIEDRADAETEPQLFGLGEVDLGRLPDLSADAITRYDLPVRVSHILIDRFLPFDERVLIRVYATPTDGRSGGGYVSYDTAGNLVNVCC